MSCMYCGDEHSSMACEMDSMESRLPRPGPPDVKRREAMSYACRVCGRDAIETGGGGWLKRVNETGVPGIWECRPSCEADMVPDERVVDAIEAAGKTLEKTEAKQSEGPSAATDEPSGRSAR